MKKIAYFLGLLVFLSHCTSYKHVYQQSPAQAIQENSASPAHAIFLWGNLPQKGAQTAIWKHLQEQISQAGKASTVLSLGNQFYPRSLADTTSREARMVEQNLGFLKEYPGRLVFIPGNRDWDNGQRKGQGSLLSQETFLEDFFQQENVFLPDGGCPGPVEIELAEDVVLLVLDTQWWMHQWDKPRGPESPCEAKGDYDFLLLVEDAVFRHPNKKVIVAGHHPLASAGRLGGHFPASDHLFPGGDKNVWLPLPGLGSAYVFYRKLIGGNQDRANVRYKQLVNNLKQIFKGHPNLIYATSHEHSMEYRKVDSTHQILSGSLGPKKYIRNKPKTEFASNYPGYARINIYDNGEVWTEFWAQEGESVRVVYRQKLFQQVPKPQEKTELITSIDYSDSIKVLPINPDYKKASGFKKLFFGKNYRNEWAEEVEFPYLNMATEKGGLEVIKRGGGQATNSLRLQAANGKQYVLRSVDKQAEKALGDAFKGTFLADIVQDQTSSAHPYGALTLPPLADAVGINHTNPRYVYLPTDPRLGKYQYTLGGDIYLFEERPDADWSDADFFGNPKDIDGTPTVIKNLTKDNDNQVDQLSVVRHRLFDIWVGDWDRHDDQWRWGDYKENGLRIYRPIPRDRDQAYWRSDGKLVRLASHRWGIPKFQGFWKKLRDVGGLNQNARYFDRYFMTEPDLQDWLALADTLKQNLNDEVIDEALSRVPDPVAKYENPVIREKLQQRREDLSRYAEEYYRFISKKVNVLGSNKHELFTVERLNNEETRVKIFKVKKKSREIRGLIYERTFKRDETREIRLYGLKGDDEFKLSGEVNKGPRIRIIGGGGDDKVSNESKVKGLSRKTIVYDKPKGMEVNAEADTRLQVKNQKGINRYDRYAFKYNYLGPLFFFGFNPDDGLFIGGGITSTTHAFRKEPYHTRQSVKGNIAFSSNSFNFDYRGEFTGFLGPFDLVLDAHIRAPNYVRNFFGLGNETVNEVDERGLTFYRIRYNQFLFQPAIRKVWVNDRTFLSLAGFYQSVKVLSEDNVDRSVGEASRAGEIPADIPGKRFNFGGVALNYQLDTRNSLLFPSRGVLLQLEGRYSRNTQDSDELPIDFAQFTGNFSFYLPFSQGAVLASRVGGGHNFGDFQFFQAHTLGARSNLRGYRNDRFSGRSSFYQNNDLRIRLFKLRTFFFNGFVGLMGVYDWGRVWQNGETSSKIHQGYGGGIWLTPADALSITATYTTSDDDNIILIRFGFLF